MRELFYLYWIRFVLLTLYYCCRCFQRWLWNKRRFFRWDFVIVIVYFIERSFCCGIDRFVLMNGYKWDRRIGGEWCMNFIIIREEWGGIRRISRTGYRAQLVFLFFNEFSNDMAGIKYVEFIRKKKSNRNYLTDVNGFKCRCSSMNNS